MRARVFGIFAALLLASCAGIAYQRIWSYDGATLNDRLALTTTAFRLERSGPAGVSVFEGSLERGQDRWVFAIEQWKPANGRLQTFDPPIGYVYRVKTFAGAVSFLELLEVRGRSPLQFIQPGDFERTP